MLRDTDHIPQFVSCGDKTIAWARGGEGALVALLKGAAGLIKMDGERVLKWQARADTRELALFMSLGCESALSQTLITSTRF